MKLFRRHRKTSNTEGRVFDPALRQAVAEFVEEYLVEEDDEDIKAQEELSIGSAPVSEVVDYAASYEADSASAPLPSAYGEARETPPAPAVHSVPKETPPALSVQSASHYGAPPRASWDSSEARYAPPPVGSAPAAGASGGLRSWLDQIDEPFSTTLLALIDHKGLSDTEVYKRAHMSRQLFSRIRSDADYRPTKKTVLALAIAMELDLEETRDLLERAGFALSRSNKRDVIVEYFVTNGIYDLFTINEALYEFDQPLL